MNAVGWSDDELERLERCPACGSADLRNHLHDVPDPEQPGARSWALDRCASCGTTLLNPRPTAEAIGKAYEGQYYTHVAPPDPDAWPETRGAALRERLLKGYVNRRFGYRLSPKSRIGEVVVPLLPGGRALGSNHVRHLSAPRAGARLLDIGCGNGAFLLRMRAAGWQVDGIEPDAEARAFASEAGLAVHAGPLDRESFGEGSFDAVTLNHVLEHLHEPRAVLAACLDVLRPGGIVWLAAPNGGASGLRRYGRHWFPLDPPRHLVFFTPDAIRCALLDTGFAEILQPPAALLASRWTYCVSRAFAQGMARPLEATRMQARDRVGALLADIRTLFQPRTGEELVIAARKRA